MAKDKVAKQAALQVFTIGHSTRAFDEVLTMLRANGVTELVDVRSLPGSRKYPQWDQDALKAALPADISYRWLRDLGGRRYTPRPRRCQPSCAARLSRGVATGA